MKIKIKRLQKDISLPCYAHPDDAGVDLCNAGNDLTLAPLSRGLVPAGIKIAVPAGWELQIRPRSGWALSEGVTVLNTPGTIDAGYRGEVKIILFNTNSDKSVKIRKGQRIAQAVLKKVERIEWEEVEKLANTSRNAGGFGSTDHK